MYAYLCECQLLSHVWLFAAPWNVTHQAPLSMGFPRQEYWNGLLFPSPGIFWTQVSNQHLLHWQADSLPLSHLGPSGRVPDTIRACNKVSILGWGMEKGFSEQVTFKQYSEKKESEVAELCRTLCDPMDCSPSGSSIHGTFQARVLEWGAISLSKGSSQPRDRTWVSWIVRRRFMVWAKAVLIGTDKYARKY